MKKAWGFLALALFAVPAIAFAADDSLSLAAWLREVFDLSKSWAQLGTWAAISALLKVLIDATKTDAFGGLFDKLGAGGKLLLISLCSAALVGTTVLSAGGTLASAAIAVVGSAAGAIALTELLKLVKGWLGIKS